MLIATLPESYLYSCWVHNTYIHNV